MRHRRTLDSAVALRTRVAALLVAAHVLLPLAGAAQAGPEAAGAYLRDLASARGGVAATSVERASAFLERLREASGVPGVTVAVARRGELVFSEGAGFADLEHRAPATPATVYNLGSISKVLTAVAVMRLVEKGSVGLDDDVRVHVPAFPEKRAPVTVRHLMTHTAGVRHYRPNDFPRGTRWDNVGTYASFEEAIGIFADDPLLFEPGAFYRYSSYGVNLLQGVVESATGLGFEEAMRRLVWAPAGMLATGFDRPRRIVPNRARGYELEEGRARKRYPPENVSYKLAGGGMIGTAEDLVRLGAALTTGGLLDPRTVDAMFRPRLDGVERFHEDGPPTPLRWRQALLWRVRTDAAGRDYVHHCGAVKGFATCLVIYPADELVVATATNAYALNLRAARILADFFREDGRDDGHARDR